MRMAPFPSTHPQGNSSECFRSEKGEECSKWGDSSLIARQFQWRGRRRTGQKKPRFLHSHPDTSAYRNVRFFQIKFDPFFHYFQPIPLKSSRFPMHCPSFFIECIWTRKPIYMSVSSSQLCSTLNQIRKLNLQFSRPPCPSSLVFSREASRSLICALFLRLSSPGV